MSRGCIAVAASGGRDSTALLHATARAARGTGLEVVALHVHHGLMPQADAWLLHLQRQCARWARSGLPVRLLHRHLAGQPGAAESVEAWARRGRYAALAQMAREAGADTVLLAHHRRDQAETFLLQALRGGGPRGLAGMPRETRREGITWVRPWLEQPAEAIAAYVRSHRLSFVEDGSNADRRFARSRLRVDVWPRLTCAFAGAEDSLAAAARHAHEADLCLRALAAIDAAPCVDVQGGLTRSAWILLPRERQANVLRHWMAQQEGRAPPESLVHRLLLEWPAARHGARWPHGAGELEFHAGVLRSVRPGSGAGAGQGPTLTLDLSIIGEHAVAAWSGSFVVRRARGLGVPAGLLEAVELRPRSGRERFQFQPRSLPRSLKKQFQAAGVPASLRSGPLVFCGERLIYVPGLGIDARAAVKGDAQARTIAWRPDGV